VVTWGNGYAEIERDERGRPVALWPVEPWRVEPGHDESGDVSYEVNNPSGKNNVFKARDMFHIKGMSADGLRGYSVIAIAREVIGLGIATERYGASFFGNSSRPAGVIEHTGHLKPEALKRFRESWEAVHGGSGNASKTAILEDGLTFKAIGIPPEDAQFLETRRFQIDEIARIFRIPPHLLGSLERATFSNISEQNVEWSRSIIPWAKRWEQESTRKLLGRATLFTKMNLDTLLRGDIKTRYEAYRVGRQWGWLSANDILRMEDMNPIGKDGDQYLVPMNMTTPELIEEPPEPPPAPVPPQLPGGQELPEGGEPQDDDTPAQRMLPVFRENLGRCVKREVSRITEAFNRYDVPGDFVDWLTKFYTEHSVYVGAALDAPLLAMGLDDELRATVRASAIQESMDSIDAVTQANEGSGVSELMAVWLDRRARNMATQVLQQINGVSG